MRSSFGSSQAAALRRAYLPAAALVAVGCCGFAAAVEDPATAAAAAATPGTTEAPAPAVADEAAKAPAAAQFHGSVELDNQYSPDTDPLRATFALSYSNLFSSQDETSALYQVAPQDPHQVGVFVASYAAHPLPDGLQPSIYFVDSNTNVPTSDTVGVLGKGQILGVRLSHALGGGEGATQSLTLGFDYKHFRNTTGFDDGSAASTPVSYLNLSLAYAGRWTSATRDAAVSVSANFGPHGGANATNPYADDDFHERANYFYLRADGEFVASLPKGVRLYLRLAGQYSAQSLIDYTHAEIFGRNDRFTTTLAYTFVGDRDDITSSGTITNHDAYDLFNLSAIYATGVAWGVLRNESVIARVQNLFDRNYSETFGFRSPPVNFLAGVKLDF